MSWISRWFLCRQERLVLSCLFVLLAARAEAAPDMVPGSAAAPVSGLAPAPSPAPVVVSGPAPAPSQIQASRLGMMLGNFSFQGWNGGASYIWNRNAGVLRLPEGDAGREAILTEYGLESFCRRSFQRGQRFITVDLYEFAADSGAFGAYYFLRKGASTVVPRGDAASEDDVSISFVQGKTFVSIYGTSQDDDESKEIVRKIADLVASQIKEHGAPLPLMSRLPRLELLRGSEKLVMGPQSARRFCPAPYLGQLFAQPASACVADYQMSEPVKERLRLLLIEYKDAAQADAAYRGFVTALCEGHRLEPEEHLNWPTNQFRNGSTFLDVESRGNYILLITGARKKFSARLLLRQFR